MSAQDTEGIMTEGTEPSTEPRTDEDWAKVILTLLGIHITRARLETIEQILEDRDAACARHAKEALKAETRG